MRPAWFVFGLWMVAACSPSPPGPPGQPADVVKGFFQAVETGDCNAATGLLSQAHRTELEKKKLPCDEYIETWRSFQFERVIETQVDGRNKKAHLVRARIRGRQADSIIRVEAEGGQWRIFSI
jgi:hypothetical protein